MMAGMGKFRQKDRMEVQQERWLRSQDVVSTPRDCFYGKLNRLLDGLAFRETVHRLRAPYYRSGGAAGGRPPVDPAVMFRMLIVGFREGIGSERRIALRCADSLSIRRFLGCQLTERTPEHSSLTVFRQRLPQEVFAAEHREILRGLKAYGLLRVRDLGVDSPIIEANATLRNLAVRNTGECYHEYVRQLAQEAGVDSGDPAAVDRFDRKRRDRKTCNREWHNPHDPDAKIGRTKNGACRMVHKPEHVVDLDGFACFQCTLAVNLWTSILVRSISPLTRSHHGMLSLSLRSQLDSGSGLNEYHIDPLSADTTRKPASHLSSVRMSDCEVLTLRRHLIGACTYLEYGAGGSTRLAVEISTVSHIVCVESDRTFIDTHLRPDGLIDAAVRSGVLNILAVDIGPTKEWGTPSDDSTSHLWPNYVLSPYLQQFRPDLILIDGRFRVACALTACLQAPEATVLFHDYRDRSRYWILERYYVIEEMIDSMAVLRAKSAADINEVRLVLQKYLYAPNDCL